MKPAQLEAAYKQSAGLAEYKPYINQLRRRRSRVLSPEAEHILALAGDNLWAEIDLNEIPSDHEKTFGALLSDVPLPHIKDEDGKDVQLTLSSYGKYRASKKRAVRRDTVEAVLRHPQAVPARLRRHLRRPDRLHHLPGPGPRLRHRPRAYLDKDDIDPAVYKNLIATIHENLGPLHDYVKLRKEVMKLDELHIYDLYTPLVPSVEMEFPFEEARKILPKALAPLGDAYRPPSKKASIQRTAGSTSTRTKTRTTAPSRRASTASTRT